MIVAVFIAGVITGWILIVMISERTVRRMISNRELTKEEWKLGLLPDQAGKGSGCLPAAAVIISILMIFLFLI